MKYCNNLTKSQLRNPVEKMLSAYDHFLDRLSVNKKKGRLDKKEEFYTWSEFVHFLATKKPNETSKKLFMNPKPNKTGDKSPFVDDRIRWVGEISRMKCKNCLTSLWFLVDEENF